MSGLLWNSYWDLASLEPNGATQALTFVNLGGRPIVVTAEYKSSGRPLPIKA